MSSSTAALSRTLRSITLTKFKELEKQRRCYEHAKNAVLQASEKSTDSRTKVRCLVQGVQDLLPPDINTKNIRRWLEQSQFDSSIHDSMIKAFEAQLRSRLDVHTRRLNLAALYSQLLTEWLNKTGFQEETAIKEVSLFDESSEIMEKDRLKELTNKFESVVFTPLQTNDHEISTYLESLFQGDLKTKTLKSLRERMEGTGLSISKASTPFDEQTIQWCLKGLLANDLLRDDKKSILQEFLRDEVARKEICDVLNMKFADLESWGWDCDDRGLPVEPRQQLNGKYRIMMDEDILDAIFLHYIGMSWAVKTKTILCLLFKKDELWGPNRTTARNIQDRRSYYLGSDMVSQELSDNVEETRRSMYQNEFFLSQLPSTVMEGAGGYDDETENGVKDGDWNIDTNIKKTSKEIKQELLRVIATEVQLHKALHRKVVVVQSDFKWFGTGIPHSTIFSVLRFIGVAEKWITFFKKFLETPLDMGPASGESASRRIRKRGVPMAHALEKFFGEVVLFFMDVAVKQEADILLYRLHDDLWLVGQPERCATAWQTMKRYSKIMGLDLNESKTGSVLLTDGNSTYEDPNITAKLPSGPVTIGFLTLDSRLGEWVIDQNQVDTHLNQLSKQLAGTTSILSWVQTWNSCVGRFFSHTFGEPAMCFGRKHVDNTLDTYKRMQETLFPGSNACNFLKGMIKDKFGIADIPDAFIFLPEGLGGLGLRNPFISSFMVREWLDNSPTSRIDRFFEIERQEYDQYKRIFEALGPQERKARLRSIFTNSYGELCLPSKNEENWDSFMSMEEFTMNREFNSASLRRVYKALMKTPFNGGIVSSERVRKAVSEMGPSKSSMGTEEELTWILQTYEKELVESCGGMSIVGENLLPLGMLKILRKRRVAWQMVL
jgi:hypothetical protein